jgi:hypothetical protein
VDDFEDLDPFPDPPLAACSTGSTGRYLSHSAGSQPSASANFKGNRHMSHPESIHAGSLTSFPSLDRSLIRSSGLQSSAPPGNASLGLARKRTYFIVKGVMFPF